MPPGARGFVGAATLLITPATVANPFGLAGTVAPGFLEPASGRRRVSGPQRATPDEPCPTGCW